MPLLTLTFMLLAQAGAAHGDAAVPRSDAKRPSNEEFEALCRVVLCRDPAPIRLRLPEGQVLEMTPDIPTPIVTEGFITVFPNETVAVEARVEGDRLVDLTAVQKVTHPERTLVFSFKQDPSLGDGTHMLLKVESPFPGVLKYRLGMMLPESERLRGTSSCPLEADNPAYEHWPHPIFQVLATDFRFVELSSDAAKTCE